MEIKNISERIFKTSPNRNENAGLHTNPFGVSFKGNIITADVFESKEKSEKMSFGQNWVKGAGRLKSRMEASAIVGSFNSMGQAFGARIDSIVKFGRTIRNNTARTWGYLKNINVEEKIADTWNYLRTNNLKISLDIVKGKKSVSALEKTFENIVAMRVKNMNELREGIAL